jgi:hypothetical protein
MGADEPTLSDLIASFDIITRDMDKTLSNQAYRLILKTEKEKNFN